MPEDIHDLLDLGQYPDLISEKGGYQALHCPEHGPMAYRLVVIAPLAPHSIQEMIEWASPADENLVYDLFRLTNGIRADSAMSGRFGTYGMLHDAEETKERKEVAVPWDINVPNLYARPKGLDEGAVVDVTNTEGQSPATEVEMAHVITRDGRIEVIERNDAQKIVRDYNTVGDWLTDSVQRALGA